MPPQPLLSYESHIVAKHFVDHGLDHELCRSIANKNPQAVSTSSSFISFQYLTYS